MAFTEPATSSVQRADASAHPSASTEARTVHVPIQGYAIINIPKGYKQPLSNALSNPEPGVRITGINFSIPCDAKEVRTTWQECMWVRAPVAMYECQKHPKQPNSTASQMNEMDPHIKQTMQGDQSQGRATAPVKAQLVNPLLADIRHKAAQKRKAREMLHEEQGSRPVATPQAIYMRPRSTGKADPEHSNKKIKLSTVLDEPEKFPPPSKRLGEMRVKGYPRHRIPWALQDTENRPLFKVAIEPSFETHAAVPQTLQIVTQAKAKEPLGSDYRAQFQPCLEYTTTTSADQKILETKQRPGCTKANPIDLDAGIATGAETYHTVHSNEICSLHKDGQDVGIKKSAAVDARSPRGTKRKREETFDTQAPATKKARTQAPLVFPTDPDSSKPMTHLGSSTGFYRDEWLSVYNKYHETGDTYFMDKDEEMASYVADFGLTPEILPYITSKAQVPQSWSPHRISDLAFHDTLKRVRRAYPDTVPPEKALENIGERVNLSDRRLIRLIYSLRERHEIDGCERFCFSRVKDPYEGLWWDTNTPAGQKVLEHYVREKEEEGLEFCYSKEPGAVRVSSPFATADEGQDGQEEEEVL